METNAMNHDHAIKTQASVRYLLKEMRDEECSAFEEHYIGCRECSDEVKFGFDVAAAIRESAMTAVVPLPRPGLLARIMASVRQPAFASAFALFLLTGSFSLYQRTIITQLKEARPELRYMVKDAIHGDESLLLPKGADLSLSLDYQPSGEFVSYEAQVIALSGGGVHVVRQPDSQGGMAYIVIPSETLKAGTYSMAVLGRTANGTIKELRRGTFKLQFAGK